MERFAAKKPTCVQFDDKLQFYRNLVIEVKHSINFISYELIRKITLYGLFFLYVPVKCHSREVSCVLTNCIIDYLYVKFKNTTLLIGIKEFQ